MAARWILKGQHSWVAGSMLAVVVSTQEGNWGEGGEDPPPTYTHHSETHKHLLIHSPLQMCSRPTLHPGIQLWVGP